MTTCCFQMFDLNKHVWNVLGWDPNSNLDAALEEYGKVWFGIDLAHDVARGLRAFEANWQGPILENKTIAKTLALWEDIAKRVPDFERNWRAQMYLFRARFDANVQAEARAQRRYEQQQRRLLLFLGLFDGVNSWGLAPLEKTPEVLDIIWPEFGPE